MIWHSRILELSFAAVYFEREKFQECIDVCQKAVEIGRENRADYQLIAKYVRYHVRLF